METVALTSPPTGADLASSFFLDSQEPSVMAFAAEAAAGHATEKDRAIALFEAVRDGFRYDPYGLSRNEADYKASAILAGSQSWCIPKSILLTAGARSLGIPARLGFADVQNHLQSEKLQASMGTSLFAWHGYSVLFVDGKWLKASSAFNKSMCERFGTKVLTFDGETDAVMHPFDESGNRHMEYVNDRGVYQDLPLDAIFATFDELYLPMMREGDEPVHDPAFHAAD